MSRLPYLFGMMLCLTFLGAVYGASTAVAGTGDTTTGLVGHWKLDETSGTTASDSAGTNDGTLLNMEQADWVDGMIGGGVSADGVNEEIRLPSPVGGDPTVNPFSLSVWTYWQSGAGPFLRDNTSLSGQGTFLGWNNAGSLYFRVGGTNIDTGKTPADYRNKWVLWTLTNNTTTSKLYANGVEIGQGAPGSFSLQSPWHIMRNGEIASFSAGIVDDVRIYNRALSADDVKALYVRSDKFCDSPTDAPGIIRYNADRSALQYCNGKNWVMMGTGSYTPVAVTFEGGADYLTEAGALSGVADSGKVTGSFWVRRDQIGASMDVVNAGPNRFRLQFKADNQLALTADNSAGANILNVRGGTITDGDWHHILFSIDLSDSNKWHVYTDGVDTKAAVFTYTDDLIEFTQPGQSIGKAGGAGNYFDGDLADFWLDFGTYIDFSSATLRDKFRSASGMPMYLGADGSLPTGKAPDIFLSGDVADWHTNKGTAGGFTETGALLYASSTPVIDDIEPYTAQTKLLIHFDRCNGCTDATDDSLSGHAAVAQDGATHSTSQFKYGTASGRVWGGRYWHVTDKMADFDLTSPFTLELWYRPDSSTGFQELAGFYKDDSNRSDFAYYGDSQTLSAAGSSFNLNGGALTALQWYHLAFTYDGTYVRAFLDGVEQDVPQANTITASGFTDLFIGCGTNSSGVDTSICAKGFIDDARFTAAVRYTDDFTPPAGPHLDPTLCASPAGVPGALIYNTDYKVMQYCNGRDWVAMSKIGGTGGGGCVSPAGVAGEMFYNSDLDVMQYCNSEDWVAIGGDACDRPGLTPGTVCIDGSIFAGDTNMYVTDGNQGTVTWKISQGTDDINPDSNTDGQANHANRAGTLSDFPAFELCENLNQHGHTDWYLPASNELLTLYTNRYDIGGFGGSWYWSSTEASTSAAWRRNFGTGSSGTLGKTNSYAVRCVRKE